MAGHYVHNNPLSYTDMNGYGFFKKLGKFFKKIWKPLLAIAAAFALQFYIGPALAGSSVLGPGSFGAFAAVNPISAAVISGVSAGVSNVILTGKPKAFLAGFGQGVATFGIGSAFSGVKGAGAVLGKAVTHGVVGGAFSEIRGGSFSSGFLAAGFSSVAADLGPKGFSWRGAAYSIAAGGAGSVLGGGKFADGAVTASFTYTLNFASHDPKGGAKYFASAAETLKLDIQDMLARVDDYDAIILNKKQWNIALGDAYFRAKAMYPYPGNYEAKALRFDTLFYRFGDDYFNIKGIGSGLGSDINYIGEGIVGARFGKDWSEVAGAVELWNRGQNATGQGGNRDLEQIKPATFWAKQGYNFYKRYN